MIIKIHFDTLFLTETKIQQFWPFKSWQQEFNNTGEYINIR